MASPSILLIWKIANENLANIMKNLDEKQRAEQVSKQFQESLRPCERSPGNFCFNRAVDEDVGDILRSSLFMGKNAGDELNELRSLRIRLNLAPWQYGQHGYNSKLWGDIFTPAQVELLRDFLIHSRFPLRRTEAQFHEEEERVRQLIIQGQFKEEVERDNKQSEEIEKLRKEWWSDVMRKPVHERNGSCFQEWLAQRRLNESRSATSAGFTPLYTGATMAANAATAASAIVAAPAQPASATNGLSA